MYGGLNELFAELIDGCFLWAGILSMYRCKLTG